MCHRFTHLCLLLSLYFCSPAAAQNWSPINPVYHYHYILQMPSGEKTDSLDAYTIRIDSVRGAVHYIRPMLVFSLAESPDPNFVEFDTLALKPSFLGEKMLWDSSGGATFLNPGSLRIHPPYMQRTPYLFDSLFNVSVLEDIISPSFTYGEPDSLRTLVLSTGDTLLLSWKFGFLQFPKGYGQQYAYRQIGVKGPDKGFNFPTMEDFVDFGIGDRFEIHSTNLDFDPPTGRTIKHFFLYQFEILDKESSPEGFQYFIRRSARLEYKVTSTSFESLNEEQITVPVCGEVTWVSFSNDPNLDSLHRAVPFKESFQHNLSKEAFAVSHEYVGGLYPRELHTVHINRSQMGIEFSKSKFRSLPNREAHTPMMTIRSRPCFGYNIFLPLGGISLAPNTRFFCEQEEDRLSGDLTYTLAPGLGLVGYTFDRDRNRSGNESSYELVAFQTSWGSFGEFTAPEAICGIKGLEPGYPNPNPANDHFTILPISSSSDIQVELFDIRGFKIWTKTLDGTQMNHIPSTDLSPGLYMLSVKLSNQDDPYFHKLSIYR